MEEEHRKEHADYRNTVYCDRHLGVKMLLADSWSSIEYGETSVSVNLRLLWRCPKPSCDRRYEPTIFGYHTNPTGRRIQTDGPKQPRGNHPGVPFMYIGKFGDGRRFKCPYYKCEEQGPVVAEAVVDEHLEPPPDPLSHFKKEKRKRVEELSTFQLFAPACGLAIDRGSPENGIPPCADILCTISGQRYWFELGHFIHEQVAEKVNPKRRQFDGGFSYDQEGPFLKLIDNKVAKRYVTDGSPVDLILHFDLRFGTAATVRRLCERHSDRLRALTTSGPFTRVWVFDVSTKAVIWHQ